MHPRPMCVCFLLVASQTASPIRHFGGLSISQPSFQFQRGKPPSGVCRPVLRPDSPIEHKR